MTSKYAVQWVSVTVTLVALAGCSPKPPVDEVHSLEGKIEKIDARSDGTGKLTVAFKDKKGNEIVGIGEVNAETEILINGSVAKLGDLKVGERITGQVKVVKRDKDKKQIVLKIAVERDTGGATAPTTGSP